MNQLHANIYRDRRTGSWCVDIDDPDSTCSWQFVRPSWPEAMQAAHKAVAFLDQMLMDEVHASRAHRRNHLARQEVAA